MGRRFLRTFGLAGAAFGVLLSVANGASTATFVAGEQGTFPKTLKVSEDGKTLQVDLSGVPESATLFRAELVIEPGARQLKPTTVYPVGEPANKLAFVKPRYMSLDALEAVKAAIKARQPLRLQVESLSGKASRLEVSYLEGKAKRAGIPAVGSVRVIHRKGQSLVVFQEPQIEAFPEFKNGGEVKAFAQKFKEAHKDLRFRIWRSGEPITPATVVKARVVGESGFFTGWNGSHFQEQTAEKPPLRYRVEDNGEPVPWGTGIYAHNTDKPGAAYYAVTVTVNGEEDLDALGAGNTTSEPVKEEVGLGVPVLQWFEEVKSWQFRRGPIVRMFYTRWESWPHASQPSVPIDYLVAAGMEPLPANANDEQRGSTAIRVEPAPVGLHFHCWGGSLYDGYGWWYNADKGAVLISCNEVPYDWWTGYHEWRGTAKGFGDGHVYPFTMNRVMGFLDWATTQWQDAPDGVRKYWRKLDTSRVFTAGNSMGGSGAPMVAIRYPDRIAWTIAWVGVHVPEKSPQFMDSYRGVYGKRDPAITMPDGKTSPWDYFSDVAWMRSHIKDDIGLIIASNGKNDGNIGWPQAVEFAKALQETRRPHFYNWGMDGHGTRTLSAANVPFDVRTDQTLPAFTHGSLDDDIGTGTPVGKSFDGVPVGALNRWLSWTTDDIVDEPGCWEMTVLLDAKAPKDSCTVDLTPRRVQKFKTPAGTTCIYTVTDVQGGKESASVTVTADEYGLVTLPQIPLAKGKNRVKIQVK